MATRLLTPAQLQALITGVPKYCPNMVFILSGQTFTATEFVTLTSGVLNASTAVTAAKATAKAAIQAEEKTIAGDGELVREARDILALMYNGVPETLSALELPERKPRKPLSTEARAAATAKARATREARGTTSKKQKAQITGGVTGVTITPITPASTSVSAPLPGAPAAASPATTTTTALTVGPVVSGTAATHS